MTQVRADETVETADGYSIRVILGQNQFTASFSKLSSMKVVF